MRVIYKDKRVGKPELDGKKKFLIVKEGEGKEKKYMNWLVRAVGGRYSACHLLKMTIKLIGRCSIP